MRVTEGGEQRVNEEREKKGRAREEWEERAAPRPSASKQQWLKESVPATHP